jgi:putative membrane protein
MLDISTIVITYVMQVLVVQFLFPKIKGLKIREDWIDSAIIVLIFSVSNYVLRTILVKFTLGLAAVVYYLTLGILGLLLDAVILLGISHFLPDKLKVDSFWSALSGGILLVVTSFIF